MSAFARMIGNVVSFWQQTMLPGETFMTKSFDSAQDERMLRWIAVRSEPVEELRPSERRLT
jgi:hypothetical protein